jgi:DNA-directed RNA polymerase specialized sigma24 family protein
MEDPPNRRAQQGLPIGTRVEVRTRFSGSWSNGFTVAQATNVGYWLRRESDQHLLPTPFVTASVRHRSYDHRRSRRRASRRKADMPVVQWDIDRYEQLQDSAWELDAWASEQDRFARRDEHGSDGAVNRTSARALRDQAARMLAQYWVLPRTLLTPPAKPSSPGGTSPTPPAQPL